MKEDFTDFIELSGLLDYDPDTISKIYAKNPKRLLKRLWQTLIPIFAYLFSVGWDKLTGRLKNEEKARFRARELTNYLFEKKKKILPLCNNDLFLDVLSSLKVY